MTKDASGRSSAAASTNSPSPHEDGDENATQETISSDKAPKGSPHLPSATLESVRLADTTTTNSNMRGAESQPMTASNSTSSNLSAKETAVSGTGAAVPYGTRSRNRTGTSRPNYAEDKEIDTEFEVPSSKDATVRKAARVGDHGNAVDTARPTNLARKIPALETEHTLTIQSHYKEPIPGTSTFSANPAATGSNHSKKRKATSQVSTFQAQLQTPAQNLPTLQAVTRRTSMAAQVVAGSRDSNMLSFESCAGRLSGKRLVADDGTVLEVNGLLLQGFLWVYKC
jgi:hypothetical protein